MPVFYARFLCPESAALPILAATVRFFTLAP